MKKLNSIFAGILGIGILSAIAFAGMSTFNSCTNPSQEEETITIDDPVITDTIVEIDSTEVDSL